ncbi:hypothetical protein TcCL_NonESM08210, partial [Trypanosoma cruzi]
MENPRNSHGTKVPWDSISHCIRHSYSQCVTLQALPLHGENKCLVVVSSRSNAPGEKKKLHRGVLHEANTPRPVSGVVCGVREEFVGTPLCHTVCPLKHNSGRVPFRPPLGGGGGIRCLAACCWRRL